MKRMCSIRRIALRNSSVFFRAVVLQSGDETRRPIYRGKQRRGRRLPTGVLAKAAFIETTRRAVFLYLAFASARRCAPGRSTQTVRVDQDQTPAPMLP